MNINTEDQAAGLRRLFRETPPEVIAAVPCGAQASVWLAHQLRHRQAAGLQILALDEWAASGNLADCLGVSPRFDLLQAVEGHVPLAHCRTAVADGLSLVPVARLSRQLGASRLGGQMSDRVLRQRTTALLASLQKGTDECLIHARPCEIEGMSELALAAPHRLLVVEPQAKSITQAYAALKRWVGDADMSTGAESIAIAVCGVQTAESKALLVNLHSVAARLLGVSLQGVSSIGEAICIQGDGSTAAGFLQRLAMPVMRAQALSRQGLG